MQQRLYIVHIQRRKRLEQCCQTLLGADSPQSEGLRIVLHNQKTAPGLIHRRLYSLGPCQVQRRQMDHLHLRHLRQQQSRQRQGVDRSLLLLQGRRDQAASRHNSGQDDLQLSADHGRVAQHHALQEHPAVPASRQVRQPLPD